MMRPFTWMLMTLTCLVVLWGNALLRNRDLFHGLNQSPLGTTQTVERTPTILGQPVGALAPTPAQGLSSAKQVAVAKRAPVGVSDHQLAAAPQCAVQAVANARRALATPSRRVPAGDVLVQGSARLGETAGRFSLMFNRKGCYLQEVEGPITVAAGFDGHASWALAATAEKGYAGADITLPEGLIAVLTGRWAAADGPYALQAEAVEPGAVAYTVRLTPRGGGEPFFVDLDQSTWLPLTAYWIQSGERDIWALSAYRCEQGVMLPHRLDRIRGGQTDTYHIDKVSAAPAFAEDPYRPASLRLARIRPRPAANSDKPNGMRG